MAVTSGLDVGQSDRTAQHKFKQVVLPPWSREVKISLFVIASPVSGTGRNYSLGSCL